jgi:sugar phosphate isomerase/epimerase
MYKNLSPTPIGLLGRQSELLEIALTHRFKGLDIEIAEVLRRAQTSGAQQACRYLCSAAMKVGGFELPVRWSGDEKLFQTDLEQIGPLLAVCTALGADRCFTSIAPTCEERAFHENFQFHVARLQQLADALLPANVKIGLSWLSAPSDRADGGFEFIHQADPMLLLLNSLQRENVGLVLDAWQWHVGGADLARVKGLRGDQVIAVRLADIPADVDISTIANEQRVMPGEGGIIDSPALLSALDEIGFVGPVSAAPWPGLFKGQTREAIVSKVSANLDSLLAGVTGAAPAITTGP